MAVRLHNLVRPNYDNTVHLSARVPKTTRVVLEDSRPDFIVAGVGAPASTRPLPMPGHLVPGDCQNHERRQPNPCQDERDPPGVRTAGFCCRIKRRLKETHRNKEPDQIRSDYPNNACSDP